MPSSFAKTCATLISDVSTGSTLPTMAAIWKMPRRWEICLKVVFHLLWVQSFRGGPMESVKTAHEMSSK